MKKKSFLDIAILAAKEAGKIHRKYYRTDFKISAKKTSYDLVTASDIEAEKKIVSCIKKSYPGHNFLAEENIYPQTSSEYTWIIDPLDGTNNFTYRLPIFSVSIALARGNEVIVGVVYDPIRDEIFSAQKGSGAYLNTRIIHVHSAKKLSESLLITGFYYDRGKDMEDNLERIKRFLRLGIIGIRRLGSAALDLSYVASGRAAGYWEFTLSPWDFAAGSLIVTEAGGVVTDRYGNKINPKQTSFVAASNGRIHKQIIKILN